MEDWITAAEATKINSDNNGYDVNESHIRWLAKKGKVETKQIDKRTKLYNLVQVKAIIVNRHKKGATHEGDQ